ncbi:hypothetical protein LZP69_08385 [Shewanella sp. AS1]|uniref:hypothetical protein n=1 Tax=Shewanella sp. AS1 TaxID=2907626 RepID=UPI001F3B2444|nr:hypothetical protein [Shewanella sp. AS1]MCE9679190.1 hypothetical protein [Shewanella sp. AS1]
MERQFGDKSRVRFAYSLTPECWSMWCQFHESFVGLDELTCALRGETSADKASSERNTAISTNMRLVWAALLIQNHGGYFIGCNIELTSKLLGMTELTFRKTIKLLIRRSVISTVVDGVKRNAFFERLLPIYKISPQSSRRKVIKLGVSLSNDSFIPFRLISELREFYRRVKKSGQQDKYPEQTSNLSNEQYFELAEVFSDKQLVLYVSHLSLSAILSLVPMYANHLNEVSGPKVERSNFLAQQVRGMLRHGLLCEQLPADADADADADPDRQKQKEYIIVALANEVDMVILELAKWWRDYLDKFGLHIQLHGYLPNHFMVSVPPPHPPLPVAMMSCVLEAFVPDNENFYDCMLLDDRLLAGKVFPIAR